jgi:Na+/glutamate symporter
MVSITCGLFFGGGTYFIWRFKMQKRKNKKDSFKIQNNYRQKTRIKRKNNNNKFEVIIIAIIFLTIVIVKWLD